MIKLWEPVVGIIFLCLSEIFVKAYTGFEIRSRCCCLHVKFDHIINQNSDVPMHVCSWPQYWNSGACFIAIEHGQFIITLHF